MTFEIIRPRKRFLPAYETMKHAVNLLAPKFVFGFLDNLEHLEHFATIGMSAYLLLGPRDGTRGQTEGS